MDNIIEIFNKVLIDGVQREASDIHLCVGSSWKYRIHGNITPLDMKRLEMNECKAIVRHILLDSLSATEENIDNVLPKLQDHDCSYMLPGTARFRVYMPAKRIFFSCLKGDSLFNTNNRCPGFTGSYQGYIARRKRVDPCNRYYWQRQVYYAGFND